MLVDAHAHLDDPILAPREEEVIAAAKEAGVGIIVNASSDLPSSEASRALAARHREVYAVVGVHPHEAKTYSPAVEKRLTELAADDKVVAFGEIGLDYHYDLSPREDQRIVLEREIALADELGLPIVFHVREAYEDFNAIIQRNKKHLTRGVLLHCYGGSAELARYYLGEMDAHFSFGGVLTFAKHKDVVLANIPEKRLLLETDCPYMTPVPFRGTPNEPKHIPLIRDKMAELKGLSRDDVERITTENALAFYKIKL